MVINTLRASVFAAAAILLATTARAAPLLHQGDLGGAVSLAENVRIVCHEDGYCYRLRGRRPMARWVYGDDVFYGPYVGPGNYGAPGLHTAWWPWGYWVR